MTADTIMLIPADEERFQYLDMDEALRVADLVGFDIHKDGSREEFDQLVGQQVSAEGYDPYYAPYFFQMLAAFIFALCYGDPRITEGGGSKKWDELPPEVAVWYEREFLYEFGLGPKGASA